MPVDPVDVNLSTQTGATNRDTYSDLIIVASEPTTTDPTLGTPLAFGSASDVESEFGNGSDAHIAAQTVEQMGVERWWVICLDYTTTTEVVGSSDSNATAQGAVSNTPVRAGSDYTEISLDGTSKTVNPTTATPPTQPDSGANFNYDTGEVYVDSQSSGAGAGIEVTYEYLDWSSAMTEMSPMGFDLCVLADARADRSYIGDADELLSWAESNKASMVLAMEDGSVYETDTAAMDAAHDIAGYLPSGNLMAIAHKSPNDVASTVAGRLATRPPWFNPYRDGGANYGFSTEFYKEALIGQPSQAGTFEGGDADGNGPVNVLMNDNGSQLLSNSLSTAGSTSDYQYFDIRRTENFVKTEVENALTTLATNRQGLGFSDLDRSLIKRSLFDSLGEYTAKGRIRRQVQSQNTNNESDGSNDNNSGGGNSETQPVVRHDNSTGGSKPLSALQVRVPAPDNLSDSAIANRVWENIGVDATLTNHVHTFSVDLSVEI